MKMHNSKQKKAVCDLPNLSSSVRLHKHKKSFSALEDGSKDNLIRERMVKNTSPSGMFLLGFAGLQ